MDEDFVNVDVILFQKHLRPNRETLGGMPKSPMGVPLLRTLSLSFAPVSVVRIVQFQCLAVLAQNDPTTLLCAPSQTLELREWNEKVLLHLALALTEAINKKAAVSTLLCRTQVL